MLTLTYYLLKVSVCSGVLFSYYFFMLRNKQFHQYNRFYLLGTVIVSFIIPVAKIKFWNETVQQEMPAIKLLKVVATRDAIVEESLKSSSILSDFNSFTFIIFSLISAALLVWLITGIVRIGILIRSNPNKSWNNINFIFTEAKGTPFSFFKYIFWNKNIDLQAEEGKHILQHELTHVQEKHSADKLFLHIALVIGWLNPFFWLIRKELNMIHEFIADEKAINDGDTDSFSAMLLKTAYPQHSFALVNSFFHSPIKRRLIMFTTSKKPSYSYLRRLMILPLLSFVIVFFSFKTKGQNSYESPNNSAKVSTSNSGKVVGINESKGNKTRDAGTDTTIEMTDRNAHTVIAVNKREMNIKTYNVDTPAILNALVVVDGVQMNSKDFNIKNIPAEKIQEIHVLKGIAANEKYGEKGTNGVIEITTKDFADKSAKENSHDTTKPKFNKVFTIVENPPYYSKGMAAFADYIQNNMQYPKEAIENKKEGAVSIQFIVDEDGKLSDFKKVSDVGFGLEEEAIRLLKNSSDWKPGIQNGHKVPVQIVQQIILRLPGSKT